MIFIGCNQGWIYKPTPISSMILKTWHNLPVSVHRWWNRLKHRNPAWQILEFIIDPSVRIARLEKRCREYLGEQMDKLVDWTTITIFPRFCPACKQLEYYSTYKGYTRCYGCLTYFDEDMNRIPDTLYNKLARLRKRTKELIQEVDWITLGYIVIAIMVFLLGASIEHYWSKWLEFLW